MESDNSYRPLCAGGCGFFASPETQNLCSKCYKACLLTNSATKIDFFPVPEDPAANTPDKLKGLLASEGSSTITTGPDELKAEIKKTRCENCNKKVGLMGFQCRCGMVLCGAHRYPKDHSCNFDFKKFDREVLDRQNPLIRADKLDSRV